MRLLRTLGSLRLTPWALGMLALGLAAYAPRAGASVLWLVAPLAALCVNLGASVATHPAFRREAPLLAFHLALLAAVAIAAAGRLTAFKGEVELAEGEVFDGVASSVERGPWHGDALARVRFAHEGFSIRYAPGLKRAETRNPVRVFEAGGAERVQVIGDTEPLLVEGYRFYTTPNKGFALLFRWTADGRRAERGAVNLPPYPAQEHRQAAQWTPPGAAAPVWTMLQFDTPPLDPERESTFRKPERHVVVVRQGERRWELAPGARLALEGGTLEYEGLSTWMGYRVFHDASIPWLLAACLAAVAALAWHFARKFAATPWDREAARG